MTEIEVADSGWDDLKDGGWAAVGVATPTQVLHSFPD